MWTNSSPTSALGSNSYNLSDDISNYKYLKFVFYNYTSNTETSFCFYEVSEFKTIINTRNTNSFARAQSPAVYSGSAHFTRSIWYVSDTQVYIEIAIAINQDDTYSTSHCIPYQIIGMK